MADRIISAEAVLKARDDGASDVLARIAGKVDSLTKAASHSEKVQQLGKAFAEFDRQAAAADGLTKAQERMERMQKRALDARENVAKLEAQIAKVEKPTDKMTAALLSAQAAVGKTSEAVAKQTFNLKEAEKAFAALGHPVEQAAQVQERLRIEMQRTTDALEKQMLMDRKAAEQAVQSARLHREAERAEERRREAIQHHGLKGTVVQGVAGAVAVHSMLGPIEHAVHLGVEAQHEKVAIQNAQQDALNKNPRLMEEIEQAAKGATVSVPTSTYTDNLKVINETTGAFGNVHHAIEKLEFMQKMASVLKASAGDKIQGSPGEMASKFAKTFEMRGTAFESDKFRDEAGQMVQAMAFSGGKFNPDEMLNFSQQAGRATLKGYEMDFLARIVPTMVGDSSGEKVGTQAKMFRKLIMGTVSDKQQAQEWVRLGLLNPSMVNMKAGHAVSWKPGAVKETELAMRNPAKWFEEVALPLIKAGGVDIKNGTKLSTELALLVRKGTANDFAETLAQESSRHQLHSDFANIKGAGSLNDQYDRNLKADPTVALSALTAAFDNLLTAVTAPAMQSAAQGITSVAESLQKLAAAAKDHPMAAMAIGGAVAAGGLAASGWAGYTILNGFGLPGASAHLEQSSVLLREAAGVMAAGHGVPGATPSGSPPNEPGKPGNTSFGTGRWLAFGAGLLGAVLNAPGMDAAGDKEREANAHALDGIGNPLDALTDRIFGKGRKAADVIADAWAATERESRIRRTERQRLMRDPLENGLDRMRAEMTGDRSSVPLPPDRPDALTKPAIVPEPFGMATTPSTMLPADAADRMRDRLNVIQDLNREEMDTVFRFGQLNDKSGMMLASFTTLDSDAGTLSKGFGTLGTGAGSVSHELDVLALAARTASTAFASLLSAAAGGAGGNGIINASFGGGWNGNPLAVAGGFGNAGWTKSGATRPEVAAYIKAEAARLGIDPNVALRVAQSEGLNTYVGDYGTSFGAFQLHYGGSGIRGMNSGGLGDRFTRATGLNARDPSTWKAQVAYALKTAKREGWGAWHGARHVGIGDRQGLEWHGKVPEEHPALAAPPLPPRRSPSRHDGPSGHDVTAKLDRVSDRLERVAAAVERGGLHRIEISPHRTLLAKKTYSRGSTGPTIA